MVERGAVLDFFVDALLDDDAGVVGAGGGVAGGQEQEECGGRRERQCGREGEEKAHVAGKIHEGPGEEE